MGSSQNEWDMRPLTPEYIPDEHELYVKLLLNSLQNDELKNIALSGHYGVGKSSILREFSKRVGGRALEISLSTLAPIQNDRQQDVLPIQAATPNNRIQREIVRQILYREKPSKAPASRFHRIHRYEWKQDILAAYIVGSLVAIVFLLTGWTESIEQQLPLLRHLGYWVHLIVLGLAALSVIAVRYVLHGKVYLKKLSAGAAKVTLDRASLSYFDQYLDEIVYFFEVSKCDIVILEDLDRYNDSHIFDELRALNKILNASPQINRTIRFIYAVKDSIFSPQTLLREGRISECVGNCDHDSVVDEVSRANRTKFFDLIIPVVPFITHNNARSLATRLFEGVENKVDPKLLDLAGRYVPDMRLLKNVRNEFVIFRDRIFGTGGIDLGLSETELFAMMLYKSTHLTDFEQIFRGNSNLDVIYGNARDLVKQEIRKAEIQIRALVARKHDDDALALEIQRLGMKLVAYYQSKVKALDDELNNERLVFTLNGELVESVSDRAFWKKLLESTEDAQLSWSNGQNVLVATVAEIQDEMSLGPNVKQWILDDGSSVDDDMRSLNSEIAFLRSASIKELIDRPDLKLEVQGGSKSLDQIAASVLGSKFAHELLKSGYLNRNFALYSSIFYQDRVSAAAMNFIIHHIEPNVMDIYLELVGDDVDVVVRECGVDALTLPGSYNISILDRLIDLDHPGAEKLIESLCQLGENEFEFIQAYVVSGKNSAEFVARFARVSESALQVVIDGLAVDDALRVELVDIVLCHIRSCEQTISQSKVPKVVQYLTANSSNLPILCSCDSDERSMIVGNLFVSVGIKLASLSSLSDSMQHAMVACCCYELTLANLRIALGGPASFALDVIKQIDCHVYQYVLENLEIYFKIVGDGADCVVSDVLFHDVLRDLDELESPYVERVIQASGPACRIASLKDVSVVYWRYLAANRRFVPTAQNIALYLNVIGVDPVFISYLEHCSEIVLVDKADFARREDLAYDILKLVDFDVPAELVVSLVRSLNISSPLDVFRISPRYGAVFSLLLKNGMIADSSLSYLALADADWSDRRSYIRASKKFVDYMSPRSLQSDLFNIFNDDLIGDRIKQCILDSADAYVDEANDSALGAMAAYASRHRKRLPAFVVAVMAQRCVDPDFILALLEAHLESISVDSLMSILMDIGSPYADLVDPNCSSVVIPDSFSGRALVRQLTLSGLVSEYSVEGARIFVQKR